jgi:hypothetical protein
MEAATLPELLRHLKQFENTSIGEAETVRAGGLREQHDFSRHLRTIETLERCLEARTPIMLYLRSFETPRKMRSTRVADPTVPGRVHDTWVDPGLQKFLYDTYAKTHTVVGVEDAQSYQSSMGLVEGDLLSGKWTDTPEEAFPIFSAALQIGGLWDKLFVATRLWKHVVAELIAAADRIVVLFDGVSDGLGEEMAAIDRAGLATKTLVVLGNRFYFHPDVQLPGPYTFGRFPYMVLCWDALKGEHIRGSEGAYSGVPQSFLERRPESVLAAWMSESPPRVLDMARYYFELGEDAEKRADLLAAMHWFRLGVSLSRRQVGALDSVECGDRALILIAWGALAWEGYRNGDLEGARVRWREVELRLERGDYPGRIIGSAPEEWRRELDRIVYDAKAELPELLKAAAPRPAPRGVTGEDRRSGRTKHASARKQRRRGARR